MEHAAQVSGTRTSNFQMWINPEIQQKAETLFSSYGLTLAEAVTVFLHQSLNTGGLPFLLSPENTRYMKDKAMDKFLAEVEKGWKSAEVGGWWTLDEVKALLEMTDE